ncbi:hypothetical protein [Halosimplex sp. J119]
MAAPRDRTDASEDHRGGRRSGTPSHALGSGDSALSVARRDIAALRRSKLLWATALVLVALTVAPVHDLIGHHILIDTHYDLLSRIPDLYYVTVGAVAAAVGYAANGASPAAGQPGPLRSRAVAVWEWSRRSRSRQVASAAAAAFLAALAYVAIMQFGPNPVALAALALGLTTYVAAGGGVGLRSEASGRRSGGLPAVGRSAFLGFALSRTVVLLALVLGTYLLQGVLVLVLLGAFEPAAYFANAGLLAVFTVMWAAIAVGFGALAATPGRAFAATLGLYLLADLTHFWHNTVSNVLGALVLGDAYDLHELTRLGNPYSGDPWWVLYLGWFNPFDGFRGVSKWLSVKLSSTHIVIDGEAREVTIGGDPVHVAYAVAIMLCWIVAFLAVGYYVSGRDERA